VSYYTVPRIETTYYKMFIASVRTWKKLGGIPARTWAALRRLKLTTWRKLAGARYVTVYYVVSKPDTTFYEVGV